MPDRTTTLTVPRVRYDPALVEAVVDLLLRAGDLRLNSGRYRRAADRIYVQYATPDERRAAFGALHLRLFEELGYAAIVAVATARLAGRTDEVVITRAWAEAEERAELSPDGQMVGLRLRPVWCASTADLQRFLAHELGHVADMLDPAFGYGAGGFGGNVSPLVAERFGCLWDCVVDGRLALAGEPSLHGREDLERACARLFSFPREIAAAVVRRLWEGERPAYAVLIRWARHPAVLAAWTGLAVHPEDVASTPRPGDPCPLCGFPTYAWAEVIGEQAADLIREEFPAWRSGDGACARCVEVYQIRGAGWFAAAQRAPGEEGR